MDKTRYYLHGDACELIPNKYYCALCDAFEHKEHFYSDVFHKDNNQEKFVLSLNAFKKADKKFLIFNFRPKEVENLFSDIPKKKYGKLYRWLKKQIERDDIYGDFARDFIDVNSSVRLPKGVNPLESETLLGLFIHVPFMYRSEDYLIVSLVGLWKEWISYKHIGLKYNDGETGYVYFLNPKGKNVFKIGKTKREPLVRKTQIEISEKIELNIFNWIKLENYSIIEAELKQAFKKYQIQKEWYQFDSYGITKNGREICREIEEAIFFYSKTDKHCKLYKKVIY